MTRDSHETLSTLFSVRELIVVFFNPTVCTPSSQESLFDPRSQMKARNDTWLETPPRHRTEVRSRLTMKKETSGVPGSHDHILHEIVERFCPLYLLSERRSYTFLTLRSTYQVDEVRSPSSTFDSWGSTNIIRHDPKIPTPNPDLPQNKRMLKSHRLKYELTPCLLRVDQNLKECFF